MDANTNRLKAVELTTKLDRISEQTKALGTECQKACNVARAIDDQLKAKDEEEKGMSKHLQQLEIQRVEEKYKDKLHQLAALQGENQKIGEMLKESAVTSKKLMLEKRRAVSDRDALRLTVKQLEQKQKNAEAIEQQLKKANGEISVLQDAFDQRSAGLSAATSLMVKSKCQVVRLEEKIKSVQTQLATTEEELDLSRTVTKLTQRRQLEQSEADKQIGDRRVTEVTDECNAVPNVHAQVLRNAYSKLITMIDAHSVAASMYERNALTLKELELIQSKREVPTEAAVILVNILLQQPYEICESFLEALKQSGQHVYSWLVNKGLIATFEF